MELIGLGILLVFAVAIIILWTRGVFARDLTQALKRVNQQEQALQEKADILEQRLTQMEREYQAKLKRAQLEAERIVQEAKNQAMNIRIAAIEEAKHRARNLLLEAEHTKTQLKVEIANELNGQAIQRACESLRTLLPVSELAALHRTLMGELLEALVHLDMTWHRAGVERVEIATAQPLTAAESQQLSQWVGAAVGTTVPLQVTTDTALVAGGVVRVGTTIVDSSLVNRLNQR